MKRNNKWDFKLHITEAHRKNIVLMYLDGLVTRGIKPGKHNIGRGSLGSGDMYYELKHTERKIDGVNTKTT